MAIRYFALVFGIVFLVVGLMGFVPAFLSAHDLAGPELAVSAGSGLLLGLFPINVIHNLVHILFGIWGIVAYKALKPAITYARAVAIVYAVFVIMGFIPILQTTFGLVPLYGHNIWLHLILAAGGAYFGWFAHPQGEPRKARA